MEIDFNKVIPVWKVNPFKAMFVQYLDKKTSREEFNKEVSYGALESIQDLKYIRPPTEPKMLTEFKAYKETAGWQRSSSDNKLATSKRCFTDPGVKEYIAILSKTDAQNDSNYYWLKIYYKSLNADEVCRKKVYSVLTTYPGFQYRSQTSDTAGSERVLRSVPRQYRGDTPPAPKHKDQSEDLPFVP